MSKLGGLVVSRSPQSPETVLAELPLAAPADVRVRAARARSAQIEWSRMPAMDRATRLRAAAAGLAERTDDFSRLMVAEVGKPLAEAVGEVARGVQILEYHAGQALEPLGETLPPSTPGGLLLTRAVPLGIAGLITPWNFPLAIPLWKAAPALAHGNAVLLKPSSQAVAVASLLAEVLDAVLPAGLFAVLPGGAETARAVIDAADVVSFTGSDRVGRDVIARATARGIPVQAELSGVNASIVLPDADVDAAARMIAVSAMGFAGQKCTATSRIILVDGAQDALDRIVAAVDGLGYGDPADPGTLVGPVIDDAARAHAQRALDSAAAAGGHQVTAARSVAGPGSWFAPTLIDGVPDGHPLYGAEVFAPFALVSRADSLDAAITAVNGSGFGLVSSVFTRDVGSALTALDRLETGLVRVNAPTTFVDFHAPFGGEQGSSFGPKEQGTSARAFYTRSRTLTVNPA